MHKVSAFAGAECVGRAAQRADCERAGAQADLDEVVEGPLIPRGRVDAGVDDNWRRTQPGNDPGATQMPAQPAV